MPLRGYLLFGYLDSMPSYIKVMSFRMQGGTTMTISANTLRVGGYLLLAACGLGLAYRAMQQGSDEKPFESPLESVEPQDHVHEESVEAQEVVYAVQLPVPVKPDAPTKVMPNLVSRSGSFDKTGLDAAGHMKVFYLNECQYMTQQRIAAVSRIHSGEYLEAAIHLRLAMEKAMEAIVAHHFGNEAIEDRCRGNIALCDDILEPDLIRRLNLSLNLLNGVVHGEPYYEDMSQERMMASVNTMEMLEGKVKACAR